MYKNTLKIVGNFVDFLPDIADNIYIRGKGNKRKEPIMTVACDNCPNDINTSFTHISDNGDILCDSCYEKTLAELETAFGVEMTDNELEQMFNFLVEKSA